MILFNFLLTTNSIGDNYKNRKAIDIDERLFERIGQDDMEAFETLYTLTERTMYAYILSLTKNHNQ
ncbi:MAG: hypothetical protein GXY88_06840 [Tissierellia bacterium]|nr:hypothetical protein [Tissierellia bacterium]